MIKEPAAVTVRLGIGPAGAVFDLIRMALGPQLAGARSRYGPLSGLAP